METPKYLLHSGSKLSLIQTILIGLPSFVLFGYNQSGLGNALSLEVFGKHFPMISTIGKEGGAASHAKTLQGLVISTFSLGAMTGAIGCNFFGDKLGRKKMIIIGAICTFIGQVLECSAFHIAQIVIGRFLIGIGIGVLNITVPTWQSECSSPKNRGKHVALDGAFISLGFTCISWITTAFYITHKTSEAVWRVPVAIGLLFNLMLISIVFLPESPRWLITQDRDEEAKKVIACFSESSIDSVAVNTEVALIRGAYLKSIQSRGSYRELFHTGSEKIFQRFLTCIYLQFIQQMCGSNLISVYSTILYQDNLGMSGTLSRILGACTLTFKFCCGFISFFTVDRFGRRILLIISGLGMSLSMLFLGICTSMPNNHSANIAAVFFIFIFNFFLPLGFLGLNWLYVVEISPTRFRNQIASIASANNWIWNFVVTMISPVAIGTIAYKYYFVFFCLGLTIPIGVYLFFPETAGLSLETIDQIYIKASTPFHVVPIARRERKELKRGTSQFSDDFNGEKSQEEQREDVSEKSV